MTFSAAVGSQDPCADPLPEDIVKTAIAWRIRLQDEGATDSDRAACRDWLGQHAAHALAWARLAAIDGQVAGVPAASSLVHAALERPRNPRRRRVLAVFGASAVGVSVAALSRTQAWRRQYADYRSAIGETRHVRLPDGSHLYLDSGSAVNLAFDTAERRLTLIAGEILVATGDDRSSPVHRPFVVETPHGTVQALGTRFVVRLEAASSYVAVYEDRVRVRAAGHPGELLPAGEALRFDAGGVLARHAALPEGEATAWRDGWLVARRMRLDDFLSVLARYRHGWLSCDPDVAGLTLSGTYPIADPDRALRMLEETLPVEARRRTRYWIRFEARR